MGSPLISLKAYLDKNKPFLIPYYQRGYVWGKSRDADKDSVQFLIESIKDCFISNTELFLQGITVCEDESEINSEIELIDGQQRTTALYLLLQYLGYTGQFSINYPIRTQSHDFISSLKGKTTDEIVTICAESKDEEYQDIYFFKKSIRTMHDELKDIDKESLLGFLLEDERVKFLYINISHDNATTVFSMMNGNKAKMRHEEIIKAELLRLVSNRRDIEESSDEMEKEAIRWDENLTRSKYAREWDKWLYWWNKKEVQEYYHTSSVLGLLVETFFYGNYPKLKFNFENFRDFILRDKLLVGKDNTLLAKEAFYKMRQLQKKFEDVYNSYEEEEEEKKLHNKIGVIQTLFSSEDRKKFIRAYFVDANKINIDEYMKYVYLGLNFAQIEKLLKNTPNAKDPDILQEKKDELLAALENNNLYWEQNEPAFIQLLRRNVEEDSKLGRKFDFAIWKERSLEHIYPKSKVFHDDNGILKNGSGGQIGTPDSTFLNRAHFGGIASEHCIGNMVLIYKNENSSFGAKDFDGKKSLYFDLTKDAKFRSRHLLHSISVFAQKEWGIKEIQENKVSFINEVKKYHGIQ